MYNRITGIISSANSARFFIILLCKIANSADLIHALEQVWCGKNRVIPAIVGITRFLGTLCVQGKRGLTRKMIFPRFAA
ncbi:MAG: hypothetical protein A3A16_00910 [Candidatus Harrisonbacteria bacterium RIFCSPLOWO2_01_FULL_44_18]|uniref:Uncharacterized protein n=1 Tax=Candidatus Harrisonbacteria bacterium RIFCSPLOWO2_01_FULL_44_18 TaxID=1798407 RepID=A0A1G1ZN12_9BACT|nr:MAG: hypothetical protein A3A16_00910 [Candidatus Harrisonbacteria bacterium RIFCSPLOWO2_01_FULL_44_18]